MLQAPAAEGEVNAAGTAVLLQLAGAPAWSTKRRETVPSLRLCGKCWPTVVCSGVVASCSSTCHARSQLLEAV